MNAKLMGRLVGGLTLAASGTYLFVYLYRWEWNRAIVAGIFVLIAELALLGSAILDKLTKLSAAQQEQPKHHQQRTLRVLRETAPPARDHFEWLKPQSGRTNVFVPVLMGAGVVLSALAWLVEKIARGTAKPVLEKGLAAQLSAIALPEGGLLPATDPAMVGGGITLLAAPIAVTRDER